VQGDLRYPGDFESLPGKFDVVFHLAAQPGISADVPFKLYIEHNVLATRNLLDYVLKAESPPQFIYISTSSVYGTVATSPESAPAEPVSWYGVTKLAAEQLVLAEARINRLNGCSLRLYSVYGPRERPDKLFSRLITCGLTGAEFPLYEGSEHHRRSYSYVGDMVEGMIRVMETPEALNKQIVNLGHHCEHTTIEGIALVESLLGTPIRIRRIPGRSGDQLYTRADTALARQLIGYEPDTPLEEGLRKQLGWHRRRFFFK
jgi:UDP-glucuronate 4-epimerase